MSLTCGDNAIMTTMQLTMQLWFFCCFGVLGFFYLATSVLNLCKTQQLAVYPATGATGIQRYTFQFQNRFAACVKHQLKGTLKQS